MTPSRTDPSTGCLPAGSTAGSPCGTRATGHGLRCSGCRHARRHRAPLARSRQGSSRREARTLCEASGAPTSPPRLDDLFSERLPGTRPSFAASEHPSTPGKRCPRNRENPRASSRTVARMGSPYGPAGIGRARRSAHTDQRGRTTAASKRIGDKRAAAIRIRLRSRIPIAARGVVLAIKAGRQGASGPYSGSSQRRAGQSRRPLRTLSSRRPVRRSRKGDIRSVPISRSNQPIRKFQGSMKTAACCPVASSRSRNAERRRGRAGR